jgi:RNA polymerase sigma factor (sigma-70 family)
MVHMGDTPGVSELVRASASGDEAAWHALVRRYAPLVTAVTRSYRLTEADSHDVSQTVWLRLVEHLGDLREPEALPRWLVTTARRECGHHIQRARRVVPLDPHSSEAVNQPAAAADDPDADIIRAELRQALRDGLAELPPRDQALLRLFAADPPKSYKEISQLLGMKIGAIGPTLGRCLGRLRETRALRAYLDATPAAGARKGGDRRELARVD